MTWTARTVVLVVALAIGSAGAAWGLHALVTASGSGTDYGLDTNGNGAFEWLVVEAGLSLPQAGTWTIYADLSAPSPPAGGPCSVGYRVPPPMPPIVATDGLRYPIAWTNERYFFPAGEQTIRMAFAGTDIARAAVDGPYSVHATLFLGDVIMYGVARPLLQPTSDFIEWNYTTKAYAASAFEAPIRPAYFTGGHTDQAVDVDGDGLADFLELRADVHVNVGGNYSLNGVLTSPSADAVTMIAYAYRTVALGASDTSVSLRFRGDQIRSAGVDGPWNFSLTLYGPVDYRLDPVAPDPTGSVLRPQPLSYPETLCGSTSAYRASDFDDTVELLSYTGRFEELTPDRDADGLYDRLVIRAEVDVLVSAAFDLSGLLRPVGSTQDVAKVSAQAWLLEGVKWVEFVFAGPDNHASGLDGPYLATLSLMPSAGRIDPTTTYTTQAYLAADFDAADPTGTQP
ncbi:MAG TPA: hypothetical protein VEM95_05575 [Thermoplasmata archaeon]|nr:hypothetical protein [Thermoplasmata archaeon]